MRLNINLASQPYEDARRFWRTWLPLLVAMVVITCILAGYALRNLRASRQLSIDTSKTRESIKQLDRQKAEAEEMLARPENSGTRDQAKFLNELFVRKAFSWTQVLSDLEKMMPKRVQVLSISPNVTRDGQIEFVVKVFTERRSGALELVRAMEGSPHFARPEIRSELTGDNGEMEVEINARYIPNPVRGGD